MQPWHQCMQFHVTPRGRSLPFLQEALQELDARRLLRLPRSTAADMVDVTSNDYLGLARRDPAAWGSTGSRLVSGDHGWLRALERELAVWLDLPSALVFTSGYAANVGALSALVGPEDLVLSDALNHASLIDGMRLSRARVQVFAHNDLGEVERALRQEPARRRWVVTESYFSMDADGPDLGALRALCDAYGALLYVDEAHALGVFGPAGRGLTADASVVPDVMVGTLGKSLGAQGAFVAGSAELTLYLWNRARSFVFSTGLSPAVARAAQEGLRAVREADGERVRLAALASRARAALEAAGHPVLGHGPLLPVVLGSEERVLMAAAAMADRGFHVQPIRPPTVPEQGARLRMTLSARESEEEVDRLVAALCEVLAGVGAR